MGRETGYYWVSFKPITAPPIDWRVAYWREGEGFVFPGGSAIIDASEVVVDERRIIQGHQRRVRKPSKRNIELTARVLSGDRMTDLAKLNGLSPSRIRSIAWRTLQKRNPTLYETLTPTNPNLSTPTVRDVRKNLAGFGFAVKAGRAVDVSEKG